MLDPLRRLLPKQPTAEEVITQVLRLIQESWPETVGQPVDLARLHADILAAVFHVGPGTGPLRRTTGPLGAGTGPLSAGTGPLSAGTGPLRQGTGPLGAGLLKPSRRAAAADALFAPETWWPEPRPSASADFISARAEREAQTRYALAYAILESAVREQPPADLVTRLENHLAHRLTQPYYDGRAPWQRPDRPSLEACLIWLAAIRTDEAVAVLSRLVAGGYNTGPHEPPSGFGGGAPQYSYALYAQPLLAALPHVLETLWMVGRLNLAGFERAVQRFDGLLEAVSAPSEENTFIHAVGPAFRAVLLDWIDEVAYEVVASLRPETVPTLKRIGQVRGVWFLAQAAAYLSDLELTSLPVAGYQTSPSLASALVHLLRIARPAPGEDETVAVARLREADNAALLTMLPLATGCRALLLAALDWPGAAEVTALLDRLSGTGTPAGEREARLRHGPLPGVLDPAAVRDLARQLGSKRLRLLLRSYAQHVPAAAEAIMLIEAVLGWNEAAVREGVERRRLPALWALGLLPVTSPTDLADRYRQLGQLVAEAATGSPERRRQERAAAEVGLINLAATAGCQEVAHLDWTVEAAGDATLAAIGQRWEIDDQHQVRLALRGSRPVVVVARDGVSLRDVPAVVRLHPAYQTAREHLANLRWRADRFQAMLERLIADGTPLAAADLARLAAHPLAVELFRRLLLIDASGQIGLFWPQELALVTLDNRRAPIRPPARLAHPLDLIAAGALATWQRWIVQRRIVQPVAQVFRETYRPLPEVALAEPSVDAQAVLPPSAPTETPVAATAFAGRLIDTRQAAEVLAAAGWQVEPGHWPYRDSPVAALRAVLTFGEPDGDLSRRATLTTGPLTFYPLTRRGAGLELAAAEPVPLAQVPPVVLCEALRVADWVVTQARPRGQRGQVYSAATLERRAELLRAVAGALELSNVTISGDTARIVGRLNTYRLHLGSAVVQVEPGRTIGRLPAARQAPPPYLPVVDDDPAMAELISALLLLATDERITDEASLALLRPPA